MDGDPAVEPTLDGFSRILPLPYRVALIIVLGTATTPSPFSASPKTHTLDSRHMGMGPQPPLPLPHKNRRPESDPLSIALLATPPLAPPLMLPHRNLPLDSALALAPALLGTDERVPARYCRLADSPKPIPRRPRRWLHRPYTVRVAQWAE
jgi:hypothetical protein